MIIDVDARCEGCRHQATDRKAYCELPLKKTPHDPVRGPTIEEFVETWGRIGSNSDEPCPWHCSSVQK